MEQADAFSFVAEHQAFWYKNSSGLVEIAVNQGSAQQQLDLEVGAGISFSQ
jgi:S-adenosylmethionine hydrolase